MKTNLVICILSTCMGLYLGSSVTKLHYEKKLIEAHNKYVESIQEARAKEEEWRVKANELEVKYQNELEATKHSNDLVINKLRKQLSQASSRVPQTCKSSFKSDDSSRRTRVSEEITKLIEFSEHCSRRLDESLVLNRALQNWIRESSK